MMSKVLCALFWNIALSPFSLPLPSVVEVSKQNTHSTFDIKNNLTTAHNLTFPNITCFKFIYHYKTELIIPKFSSHTHQGKWNPWMSPRLLRLYRCGTVRAGEEESHFWIQWILNCENSQESVDKEWGVDCLDQSEIQGRKYVHACNISSKSGYQSIIDAFI